MDINEYHVNPYSITFSVYYHNNLRILCFRRGLVSGYDCVSIRIIFKVCAHRSFLGKVSPYNSVIYIKEYPVMTGELRDCSVNIRQYTDSRLLPISHWLYFSLFSSLMAGNLPPVSVHIVTITFTIVQYLHFTMKYTRTCIVMYWSPFLVRFLQIMCLYLRAIGSNWTGVVQGMWMP